MPFTIQHQRPHRGTARRFRWIIAGIFFIVAAAVAAQLIWGSFWSWERPAKAVPIRQPTMAIMPDYELPDPADPEVRLVHLPVARPTPTEPKPISTQPPASTPPVASAPAQRRMEKLDRLPAKTWNVDAQLGPSAWAHDGRREAFGLGCTLRRGAAEIPAVLTTAINSELPGEVRAMVTEDVYSPDAGYENKVLVPKGTMVAGVLDKGREMSFDRRRVEIVWQEMSHSMGFGGDPRYTQVDLADAHSASADGSAGSGGTVEHRWGTLAAYAALTTIFNVAQRRARTDDPIVVESGRTIGTVGHEVLDRSLDWEPTIRIPAGTQVRIMPNKTIRLCG